MNYDSPELEQPGVILELTDLTEVGRNGVGFVIKDNDSGQTAVNTLNHLQPNPDLRLTGLIDPMLTWCIEENRALWNHELTFVIPAADKPGPEKVEVTYHIKFGDDLTYEEVKAAWLRIFGAERLVVGLEHLLEYLVDNGGFGNCPVFTAPRPQTEVALVESLLRQLGLNDGYNY